MTCPECDGKGEVLDAPSDVLVGRPYLETCGRCHGKGTILRFTLYDFDDDEPVVRHIVEIQGDRLVIVHSEEDTV